MNNKKQRNRLFTMLLLVMALLIPQWGWAQETSQPSVGDGTANNPYIITKAEELAWFRDYVNGVIVDEGEAPGTVHLSASAARHIHDRRFIHTLCQHKVKGKKVKILLSPILSDNFF